MNYEKLMNRTLQELKPSGIRKFFDIAAEMDEVISLSVGEPDFSTPWHIRQEGMRFEISSGPASSIPHARYGMK